MELLMTPRTFGTIAVVYGTVMAIVWGVWGGNLSLVLSLIGGAVVAVSAMMLDDPGD